MENLKIKCNIMLEKLKCFFESKWFMLSLGALTFLLWNFDVSFTPYFIFVGILSLILLSGAEFISIVDLYFFIFASNRGNQIDTSSYLFVILIIVMVIPLELLVIDIIKNRKKYYRSIKHNSIIISMLVLFLIMILSWSVSVKFTSSLSNTFIYLITIIIGVLSVFKIERNEENQDKLMFSFFVVTLVMTMQFGVRLYEICTNDNNTWEQLRSKELQLGYVISNHAIPLYVISMISTFYLYIKENKIWLKVIYFITIISSLFIILVSLCRAAWLGLAFATPFLIYAYIRYTKNWKKESIFLTILVLCGCIGIYYFFKIDVLNQLIKNGYNPDSGLNGRDVLWNVAIDKLNNNYLLGTGYGTSYYLLSEMGRWEHNYHNLFLQISTCGILGIIGLIVVLFMSGRRVWINKGSLFGMIVFAIFVYIFINANLDTVYFNKRIEPFFLILILFLPGRKLKDLTYQEELY